MRLVSVRRPLDDPTEATEATGATGATGAIA
jgi:hypothetical protein